MYCRNYHFHNLSSTRSGYVRSWRQVTKVVGWTVQQLPTWTDSSGNC